MRSIPVNTSALTLVAVAVVQATDQDGKPKANQMGEPLWRVQLLVTGDGAERAELLDVTVPGERPTVQPMQPVEAVGLTARGWSMGDRSGISFSTSAIRA